MKKKIAFAISVGLAAIISNAASIDRVVVRQLWPWSAKVEIAFLLSGEVNEDCDVKLQIFNGDKPLDVYASSLSGELTNIAPGEHKVFLDPTVCGVTNLETFTSLRFSVTAQAAAMKKYMLIDISGGADAQTYPVSYLDAEPEGGVNQDEYKLNKIIFRRIRAGMFLMGSPADEAGHLEQTDYASTGRTTEQQVPVLLTNDYYMAVFPVTLHQATNVCAALEENMAGRASWYLKSNKRPAAYVSFNDIVGQSATTPLLNDVEESSFIGLMRKRTAGQALPEGYQITLPTEAQWEYACRAGTTTAWNNGVDCVVDPERNNADANADLLGLTGNFNGTKVYAGSYGLNKDVGCFLPNAWNLYDMHGLVNEYTCHGSVGTRPSTLQIEPLFSNENGRWVQARGGSCADATIYARSAAGLSKGKTVCELQTGFRLIVGRIRSE